jgi:hypothetical protein
MLTTPVLVEDSELPKLTALSHFPKIDFNIILQFSSRSSKMSITRKYPYPTIIHPHTNSDQILTRSTSYRTTDCNSVTVCALAIPRLILKFEVFRYKMFRQTFQESSFVFEDTRLQSFPRSIQLQISS